MAGKKKDTKDGKKKGEDDTPTRIAVVSAERCRPKKCKQECKKYCPVVKVGKLCVEVTPASKVTWISEELCIGCGICIKKCPFDAITIINLPSNLESQTTHRYGPNSFKLHRLPMPRPGQVRGCPPPPARWRTRPRTRPCQRCTECFSIRVTCGTLGAAPGLLRATLGLLRATSWLLRGSCVQGGASSPDVCRFWAWWGPMV